MDRRFINGLSAVVLAAFIARGYVSGEFQDDVDNPESDRGPVTKDGEVVGHMYIDSGFVSLAEQSDPDFDPDKLRSPVTTFEVSVEE